MSMGLPDGLTEEMQPIAAMNGPVARGLESAPGLTVAMVWYLWNGSCSAAERLLEAHSYHLTVRIGADVVRTQTTVVGSNHASQVVEHGSLWRLSWDKLSVTHAGMYAPCPVLGP